MKRPTFFLSSTIFDFADLRGAIKFHLEARGCQVLASEFNDFRKPLDRHSYEACLQSIEQADYFVLLVGTRVGGWYDVAGRVSITQQEYRTAYRLHLAGRLKILALTRRDVWTFRENHKALERHLRSLDLDAETAGQAARYPTKFAEDASFVVGFLEEIGRNQETKAALGGKGPMPTGNWIHVFDDFRDVATVLDTVLLGGLPADEVAYRRALRHELIELLRMGTFTGSSGPFGPRSYIDAFRTAFPITMKHRNDPTIAVPTKVWDQFASVMMQLLGRRFNTTLLPLALAASTFMDFDAASGGFRESEAFTALHRLNEEIRGANQALDSDVLQVIFTATPRARGGLSPRTLTFEFSQVASLVNLGWRWANIVALSEALAWHLDGGPFLAPELLPRTIVEGFEEELDRSVATAAQIEAWLRRRSPHRPDANF